MIDVPMLSNCCAIVFRWTFTLNVLKRVAKQHVHLWKIEVLVEGFRNHLAVKSVKTFQDNNRS
jgi:hypothetical protein